MNRIFYFMMAAFMFIGIAATAQTIENNGVFSKMNIGVKCGANYSSIGTIRNFDFNVLNYNAAIEIGKDVTPITGFSIEGISTNDLTNGLEVLRTDVFGNTKFNLMNLFGGYKGYPRRVEIRTVTGIGWNHNFKSTNPNDIALQGGLEFDFNLGKNRNWYITFSPMLQTNDILQSEQVLYAVRNSDLKASVGAAYRLGCGNGSHNFKIVENYSIENDYNELLEKYNILLNNETENKIDTVIVEKMVETVVEKLVSRPAEMFVIFKIGSSEISKENMNVIYSFANAARDSECGVKVIGSADSSTGSKEVNEKLATERAKNVAKELSKLGIDAISTEVVIDIDEDAEVSRCALIIPEW